MIGRLLDHRSIIDFRKDDDTAVGNVCKFKASNDHGGNFRRAQRANPAGLVQTSIAERDHGRTVKSASMEQIWALGVRSNQDPTTTAPPQSRTKESDTPV